MFIPFCLDVTPPVTLKDAVYYATVKFGLMYYRYRLPYYAHIGYELAEQNTQELFIERYDEFHKVVNYINNFRNNVLSYQ